MNSYQLTIKSPARTDEVRPVGRETNLKTTAIPRRVHFFVSSFLDTQHAYPPLQNNEKRSGHISL
jgi:hypothetical protein